jgi:RNA polymerase sigma factor (sigma-70 family)
MSPPEFGKNSPESLPYTEIGVAQGKKDETGALWLDAHKIASGRIRKNPRNYRPESIHDDLAQEASITAVAAVKNRGLRVLAGEVEPLDNLGGYVYEVVGRALARHCPALRGERRVPPRERLQILDEILAEESEQHHQAKQQTKQQTTSLDATVEALGDAAMPTEIGDLEEEVMDRSEAETLREILNDLGITEGSEDWDCLTHKEFGLTSQEIADKHGLTSDNVRTKRSRLRKQLREEYGRRDIDPPEDDVDPGGEAA